MQGFSRNSNRRVPYFLHMYINCKSQVYFRTLLEVSQTCFAETPLKGTVKLSFGEAVVQPSGNGQCPEKHLHYTLYSRELKV